MADRLLVYVEIDLVTCANVYGVPPCLASLDSPATGDIKCFNTLATCQDRANFNPTTTTLRFATDPDYRPRAIEALPVIKFWSIKPPRVSLGEDLGERGGMNVTLIDAPHPDTGPGFDPYLADRDYNPFDLGTLFGKFRARQPFVSFNDIRLITGFEPDEGVAAVAQGTAMATNALRDQVTRHYMVQEFDGPRTDGTYELIAKDLLKLAEGRRGQAPRVSNGFLANTETSGSTSFELSPAGIGDLEYPNGTPDYYVQVGGEEVVLVTARSGDTLTVTRAQLGTVAVAHEAGDRVQQVLRFVAESPADIIRNLLVDYAEVDAGLIPQDVWNEETSAVSGVYSGDVAEPTAVDSLISEVIRDAALALWWDSIDREYRLQALRAIPPSAEVLDETRIREGTLRVKEQPDRRLSQVWTSFAKRTPLGRQEDSVSFRSAAATIDLEKQSDYGGPAIKKIFTRWIPTGGRAIAERLNSVFLSRFRDPPRLFQFEVWRDAPVRLGGGYLIEYWSLQDATGARVGVPVQVTRIEAQEATLLVEAEEMLFEAPAGTNEHLIVFDSDQNNINLREVHDLLYGSADEIDTGASPQTYVRAVVQAGTIIGSSSTSLPALDIGSWPSGVPIFLEVRGRIQGAGGRGGTGGKKNGTTGQSGFTGGPALLVRETISLDSDGGEIWGGGGGGGGGGRDTDPLRSGGGGGGGQGTIPGNGGNKGGDDAQDGRSGTADDRGNGGDGTNSSFRGGPGGFAGSAGQSGSGSGSGSGGAAGPAIDGISFCTVTDQGDHRGNEIN